MRLSEVMSIGGPLPLVLPLQAILYVAVSPDILKSVTLQFSGFGSSRVNGARITEKAARGTRICAWRFSPKKRSVRGAPRMVDKAALRREMVARRDALPDAERERIAAALTEQLLALPEYAAAGSV